MHPDRRMTPPSPFPKLYAETPRGSADPLHQRILNELGAYFQSTRIAPKRRNSGFGGGTLTYVEKEKP